jgi:hypothetical protein
MQEQKGDKDHKKDKDAIVFLSLPKKQSIKNVRVK